jgi:hypothetical protein
VRRTSPEQIDRLAANSWSPVWIENNTPKEGPLRGDNALKEHSLTPFFQAASRNPIRAPYDCDTN